MQAKELMSHPTITVRSSDSLSLAAGLMQRHACACVVVVEEGDKAKAVLTERDICMAALKADQPLSQLRVAVAMSNHLHTCHPEDELATVEQIMDEHQVWRLPVVDAAGRAVGLLALDDIAKEARRERDLFAPQVSPAEVGRTLGQIARPHLILDDDEQASP